MGPKWCLVGSLSLESDGCCEAGEKRDHGCCSCCYAQLCSVAVCIHTWEQHSLFQILHLIQNVLASLLRSRVLDAFDSVGLRVKDASANLHHENIPQNIECVALNNFRNVRKLLSHQVSIRRKSNRAWIRMTSLQGEFEPATSPDLEIVFTSSRSSESMSADLSNRPFPCPPAPSWYRVRRVLQHLGRDLSL